MARLLKRRAPEIGLPPGTLVHIGERKTETAQLSLMEYSPETCREVRPCTVNQCLPTAETKAVRWINLDGIHDLKLVEELGQAFGVHPLVLEDIVNTGQRPKFEDYGDYIFMVVKMLYLDPEHKEIIAEQVSLLLGRGFVLSFQEAPGDVFDIIRERIRQDQGRIRKMGSDYLAYSLMDALLDNYFVVLERFAENIEWVEDHLVERPSPGILQEVYTLKREAVFLRKCAWPLRELFSALERSGSSLVRKETALYLRDLYDHTIQVVDTVEMFRESISGMLDVYLSSASNRMNEVMKVLTIIATIFIPLTFIAGVYGMNLQIPETNWAWSYPAVWAVMLAVAGGMLYYFRKRRWL